MNYYGYYALDWWVWLIAVGASVGLAFIPASMAKKKGYSYGGFWVFGFFLWLVAIIVAACLNPKTGYGQNYQQNYYAPQPPPPAQGPAPYGQSGPVPPYGQAGYAPPYPPQGAQAQWTGGEYRCPQCGTPFKQGDAFCVKCGTKLM